MLKIYSVVNPTAVLVWEFGLTYWNTISAIAILWMLMLLVGSQMPDGIILPLSHKFLKQPQSSAFLSQSF